MKEKDIMNQRFNTILIQITEDRKKKTIEVSTIPSLSIKENALPHVFNYYFEDPTEAEDFIKKITSQNVNIGITVLGNEITYST